MCRGRLIFANGKYYSEAAAELRKGRSLAGYAISADGMDPVALSNDLLRTIRLYSNRVPAIRELPLLIG